MCNVLEMNLGKSVLFSDHGGSFRSRKLYLLVKTCSGALGGISSPRDWHRPGRSLGSMWEAEGRREDCDIEAQLAK
jgi:hypothetical protein